MRQSRGVSSAGINEHLALLFAPFLKLALKRDGKSGRLQRLREPAGFPSRPRMQTVSVGSTSRKLALRSRRHSAATEFGPIDEKRSVALHEIDGRLCLVQRALRGKRQC